MNIDCYSVLVSGYVTCPPSRSLQIVSTRGTTGWFAPFAPNIARFPVGSLEGAWGSAGTPGALQVEDRKNWSIWELGEGNSNRRTILREEQEKYRLTIVGDVSAVA